MDSQYLMHIVPRAVWELAKSRGEYRPDSLASEGFIHLSTRSQVTGVANRFFKGQRGLLVLQIHPARLKAEVRFEAVPDSPEHYPHLYGPLNLDAVEAIHSIEPSADGTFASLLE